MRRLFAVAIAACALAAVPAAADPTVCTPTKLPAGYCAEYVCVDICGPEIVITSWCDLGYRVCSALPGQ